MNDSLTGCAEIDELDLSPIKRKLMHEGSGKGWTQARADAAEREYRRFLYLMKLYPDELTAPSVEVDTFWHQHILDTAKYARDCDTVFGYFLHHYPYLGLRGATDEALRQRAGQRMRALYAHTFGSAAGCSDESFCTVTQATGFCTVTSQPQSDAAGFCTVTQADDASAADAFCTVTRAPRRPGGADADIPSTCIH